MDNVTCRMKIIVFVTMFSIVVLLSFNSVIVNACFQNAAGGILGLIGGMLIETFLFIIRTSSQDRRSSTSTSKQKKDQ